MYSIVCQKCGKRFAHERVDEKYCNSYKGYSPIETKTITCVDCGKAFADRDGIITIANVDLSSWTKIHHTALSGRVIPEIIDFGYIEKIKNEETFTWNKKVKSKSNSYKILVDVNNDGAYVLNNNDIEFLYNICF